MSPNPLPHSTLCFHTPSHLAASHFLYPVCIGHFFCEEDYHVNRSTYPSFLLLVSRTGEGHIQTSGGDFILPPGEIALIDCYEPHSYRTGSSGYWEFYWLHLDGISARTYYDLITEKKGCHFALAKVDRAAILSSLNLMLDGFSTQKICPEALMNKYITDILTQLLLSSPQSLPSGKEGLEKAVSYIRQNYQSPITIAAAAATASMSPYYFIREFKKFTGMTPHQYLLSVRLNSARFYLSTTEKSIKEIGFLCGFQSENSFCISFKKHTKITPGEYRGQ